MLHATMPAMSESSPAWASPSGEPPAPAPAPGPPIGPAPAPAWQAPPGWGGPPPYGGWGQPRPPEPQPGVVPLRPLGLGELLDGAVGLVRRYPRPVLGLSAVLAILATVLNVLLALTAFQSIISFDTETLSNGGSTSTDQLDGALGGAAVGGLGSGIVSALATIVLTGIITAIAGRGILGQPMTLGAAWAQVRPALLRLIGIALLTGLLVYGALAIGIAAAVLLIAGLGAPGALLGVPLGIGGGCLAVYLYCRLALAPAAAVLERAGVRTSLRRSGILVRRSWWRVFGVLLLALIVASVVGQVVQVPFLIFGIAPLGFGGGSGVTQSTTRVLVLSYIGAGIAQTVIAPFTAGVRALLYIDRRMRAEGLDVALNAAVARPAA
ncbi:MAG: hypothetical protein QOE99_3666 [Actinomycetota bacterium]|nr:hypothetical protein [Actinomycetota bacterium]